MRRIEGTRRVLAIALVLAVLGTGAAPLPYFAKRQTDAVAESEPVTEAPDEDAAGQEVTAAELAGDEALLSELNHNRELDMQTRLNALFERYDTLGACVCVIENGSVTHTFCYGEVAPGGEKVSESTLFRVGSISKMVAAMGVMRLVEAGQTTLDVDLSDLFGFKVRSPEYPNTAVTLRQMMSHTAALRDNGYYTLALRGEARTLNVIFTRDSARYLFLGDVKPGTQAKYSNFGGGLLGTVIEKLYGETVDAYLKQTLFDPLGITAAYQGALIPPNASVADIYAMPDRWLSCAVRGKEAAYDTPDPWTHYNLTAGKLAISAPDLAKLVIALCDGGVYEGVRVLRESSAAAMVTPQNNIGSVNCDSGWGLDVNVVTDTILPGRTLYGHGGKANGMLCAAYFDPTDRTGVVMLTNGCDNWKVYNGVGMLSVMMIRLCYTEWLENRHATQDPWLVQP